jgi:RNA polymerase sigma factor (sigma-70 family)
MMNGQLDLVLQHIQRLAGAPGIEGLKDGPLLERFAAGEEAAFAALVRRHGPMVLGVCRRVLGDLHAAEDAFQATFLVLLRRAAALNRRGSLASWLYTVAYRVALRARAAAARRQCQERKVAHMADSASEVDAGWLDLQPILDEELSRLPENYRVAVLLCCVQGKTNVEAARLLGWPLGTVKGRLARARELLRERLGRRGITLPAAGLVALLAENAAAAVPGTLIHATVQAAVAASAGATVAASASALSLAEGVLKAMFVTKLKIASVLLLGAGLLALAAGALADPAPAPAQGKVLLTDDKTPAPPNNAKVIAIKPPSQAKAQAKERTITGRILGEGKRPLAGARVAVVGWWQRLPAQGPEILGKTQTDKAGKFRLTIKPPLPPGAHQEVLLATAAGHGLGWGPADGKDGVEIQLAPEQVIRGRLLDVQGNPAAGVQVAVSRLGGGASMSRRRMMDYAVDYVIVQGAEVEEYEDFEDSDYATFARGYLARRVLADGWLLNLDRPSDRATVWADVAYFTDATARPRLAFRDPPANLPFWPKAVTTDDQGRFALHGIGRGEGVGLQVRDPRFALQALDVPPQKDDKPAEVPLILQQRRLLEGTVTDAASGRPVPHARLKVRSPSTIANAVFDFDGDGSLRVIDWRGRRRAGGYRAAVEFAVALNINDIRRPDEIPVAEVKADAQGRFRLPLHHAGAYTIAVAGPPGAPYLARVQQIEWPKGAVERKQQDFTLVRGVPVKGKVTEAPGGKAVAWARVDFWSKGLKLPAGVRFPRPTLTREDGTFQALLPPASWHLVVTGPAPAYRFQKLASDWLVETKADNKGPAALPPFVRPDAWKALDLKAGEQAREVSLTLQPAPLLRGRLVGPDGQAVARARLLYQQPLPVEPAQFTPQQVRRLYLDLWGTLPDPQFLYWVHNEVAPPGLVLSDLKEGTFAVPVHDPEATYRLHFLDAAACLGTVVELAGQRAGGEPLTVPLAPCGQAQARLLDAQGKALAKHHPLLWLLPGREAPPVPKDATELMAGGLGSPDAVLLGKVDPLHYGKGLLTHADGRVTLPALIPTATYRLLLGDGKARDFTVRQGQTLTLPDLTVVRPELLKKVPAGEPGKKPR